MSVGGDRLKELRTERGISGVDFADKTGVSKQLLYRYERGLTQMPPAYMSRAAKVLNVNPGYLAGWTDMKLPVGTMQDWQDISAVDGLIAIIRSIYGDAEMEAAELPDCSVFYCRVGEDKAITDVEFDAVLASVKASIKPMIDMMLGDIRQKTYEGLETTADCEAAYIKSRLNNAPYKEPSALSTTEDTESA